MRSALLILISIICFLKAYSQSGITGCVLDIGTRSPLAGVTVTLHPAGMPSILAYTMTDKDGTFILKRPSFPDSVTVTVSAMTIERQSKTIKGNTGFVEFLVKEKNIELKEVIVKAPKIRQTGDTIHYDVAAFQNETDRSIGDVLKKLPGVQVLSSGQILYQDKEISKFYIEGLDLLKGKYGLATQNVEASKVATVQILENHQPIKALKDMEIPEYAAINLKLKQSSIGAFFATAQAGAGLPALLLSNEVVGMRFTRTQQNMQVYKGDNTGRDISKELSHYYDHYGSNSYSLLSVISPIPPAINEQHFLFNDAHLISLNDLRGVREDLTLTTNINFLHDKQESNSISRRNIFLTSSDTVLIAEDMDARLLKRELEGSLTLEGNTDDYFLNNKINVRSSWNAQNSSIAADEPITQSLKIPSFHIENDFDYLRRNGNKKHQIKANMAYSNQNHSLDVSPILFGNPENFDSPTRQNVSFEHLKGNVAFSGNKGISRMSIGYTTGISYDQYFLESGLFSGDSYSPIVSDSLQNQNIRTETKLYFSPVLTYSTLSGSILSISFPVNYLFLNRKDKIRQVKQGGDYLLFSPLLVLQYPLSIRFDIHSNISFSNGVCSVNEDYKGYILNTYRSMNRNGDMLSKNNIISGFVSLGYKNPFSTLFASLQLSYNSTRRDLLYDVNYSGILSSSVGIRHPNTTHNYGVRYSMGQSIDAISSKVGMYASYNRSQAVVLTQGTVSNYNLGSYSVSPHIVTDIGRFIIVQYGASFRHSLAKIGSNQMIPLNNLAQDITTSFIPTKGMIMTFSFNHYYNNMIESSARSSWFGNLGARYRIKDVDLMLDWTNIFNTRQFVTYSYSDISRYYSAYDLRPAEVMLRVRFKIL